MAGELPQAEIRPLNLSNRMENKGMIILTDTARKELEGYFQGQDKKPIRVYLKKSHF